MLASPTLASAKQYIFLVCTFIYLKYMYIVYCLPRKGGQSNSGKCYQSFLLAQIFGKHNDVNGANVGKTRCADWCQARQTYELGASVLHNHV